MFEVVLMWRVKPQGVVGWGGGKGDSQIRGKDKAIFPKCLGPTFWEHTTRTWASPIIKWLYPP